MTKLLKSIHRWEARFDQKAEVFAMRHPCLAFCAMFIGIPVFVLVAVCACTIIISLFISFIISLL